MYWKVPGLYEKSKEFSNEKIEELFSERRTFSLLRQEETRRSSGVKCEDVHLSLKNSLIFSLENPFGSS